MSTTKVPASTSVGRSCSQSDSTPEQKGFLSGSVKKYIVTALCIGGAIATREALGLNKTATGIILVGTALSMSIGTVSYALNGDRAGFKPGESEQKISQLQEATFTLGSIGFLASLSIVTAVEISFQMLHVMKDFID